jgi:5'-methylthioadenosine phosphorylase
VRGGGPRDRARVAANGVASTPEPVEALVERMNASPKVFATLVEAALPRMAESAPAGIVYRFGS